MPTGLVAPGWPLFFFKPVDVPWHLEWPVLLQQWLATDGSDVRVGWVVLGRN